MSRPSGRMNRFRGTQRRDEFQHGPLEENQPPETSMTRNAAFDNIEAIDVALASHTIDAFATDGLTVCLEQVAEDFGSALTDANVWAH